MAIKPRPELQERPETEPGMVHYLIHGEMSTEPGVNRFLNNFPEKIRKAWEMIGEAVTRDFIKDHPCTRPWAWWMWSAPRQNDSDIDCYWHGTLPEPRLRIGGSGTPSFECMGTAPGFRFGLPSFPTAVHADAGLCAINDVPDPDDLPVFESQAAYLKRHGLLTPAEKRWLAGHPAALQPEIIKVTE